MNLSTLQERNDRYVRRVFAVCGGNVDRTSAALGIGRATTYRWLKRLGVDFGQRVLENNERQRKPLRDGEVFAFINATLQRQNQQ